MPHPFYLGLNLPGAVSAGAYSAGVMDFLIEALDTWYAARSWQDANNPDAWTIPPHKVELAGMAGASAGGMVSAISAAALTQTFDHIHTLNPAGPFFNPLYQAWVQDIDASFLLSDGDLSEKFDPVLSLLNSNQIDAIADRAIAFPRTPAKRPWVADRLRVSLTVTNLGGIPYSIEGGTGAEETETLNRADRRDFDVRWDAVSSEDHVVTLNPRTPEANWDALRDVAKATGAFPIALRARELSRDTGEYNRRTWRISLDEPECNGQTCRCCKPEVVTPIWTEPDGVPFKTLNVDGGVTNNSPFGCIHDYLVNLPDCYFSGHMPREPERANRAVVSIAPFLDKPNFKIDDVPKNDLLSVAGAFLATVVAQSRIQGENIQLTSDPTVYSRFVIAPSIDSDAVNALASSAFSAFGGFLAREFRAHDYQLGRRNCQQFLRRHLALPPDNVWLRQWASAEMLQRFAKSDAYGTDLENKGRGVCLIPLVDGTPVSQEVTVERTGAQIDRDRLYPVSGQAIDRLKLLLDRLYLDHANVGARAALNLIWLGARGRLRNKLLTAMAFQLASEHLIR